MVKINVKEQNWHQKEKLETLTGQTFVQELKTEF